MNIILGSQSPRRRELLSGLDLPHRDVSIDADESYPHELVGGDIPKYISRAKAEAYTRTHELSDDELLITSDPFGRSAAKADHCTRFGKKTGHPYP